MFFFIFLFLRGGWGGGWGYMGEESMNRTHELSHGKDVSNKLSYFITIYCDCDRHI